MKSDKEIGSAFLMIITVMIMIILLMMKFTGNLPDNDNKRWLLEKPEVHTVEKPAVNNITINVYNY